jgi:hypothetical protein
MKFRRFGFTYNYLFDVVILAEHCYKKLIQKSRGDFEIQAKSEPKHDMLSYMGLQFETLAAVVS